MGARSAALVAFGLAAWWLGATAGVPEGCVTTVAGLKRLDSSLHRTWVETSMSDGKPLVLSFPEEDGELHLVFDKTDDGPWARGKASVCRHGAVLEARLTSVQFGPAAPWLLRNALGTQPVFLLTWGGHGDLQVTTPGWSGRFAARR